MKPHWKIQDLIDLEFFIQQDKDQFSPHNSALHKRDRKIYTQAVASREDAGSLKVNDVLKAWLDARKTSFLTESDAPLPGQMYKEITTWIAWALFLTGLVAGATFAGSFLVYTGDEPLNVSMYFIFFVLLQVILSVLQVLIFFVRKFFAPPSSNGVAYGLISRTTGFLFTYLQKKLHQSLSGKQRIDLAVLIASLRKKKGIAKLFLWPIFRMAQILAIGFNMAVLLVTLLKVTIADVGFGWQSSLQIEETMLAEAVRWIALPWSWFCPESIAYPGAEQIAGSKIILKEGIYHLATQDLVAWWPFLCFAVFFYGLMPRCLLFCAGRWQQRKLLNQVRFTEPFFRQLIQRMTTPVLSTKGDKIKQQRQSPRAVGKKTAPSPVPTQPVQAMQAPPEPEKEQSSIPEKKASPQESFSSRLSAKEATSQARQKLSSPSLVSPLAPASEPEPKTEPKTEPKPATKQEVPAEVKPVPQPAPKEENIPDLKPEPSVQASPSPAETQEREETEPVLGDTPVPQTEESSLVESSSPVEIPEEETLGNAADDEMDVPTALPDVAPEKQAPEEELPPIIEDDDADASDDANDTELAQALHAESEAILAEDEEEDTEEASSAQDDTLASIEEDLAEALVDEENKHIGEGRAEERAEEMADELAQDLLLQSSDFNELVADLVYALVPDELFEDYPPETITSLLRLHTGSSMLQTIRYDDMDPSLDEFLEQLECSPAPGMIILLQEAWQPPIQETLTLIQELRKATSISCIISMALLGKPRKKQIMPAIPEHMTIWNNKLATLADTHVNAFSLVSEETEEATVQ